MIAGKQLASKDGYPQHSTVFDTEDLIESNWWAATNVARALLEKREMTYTQVLTAILQE